MKIAITAASGALGASIIKQALTFYPKENIIALARTKAKAESLGVEVRGGDYDQPQQLEASLQGIDTVLLISGMTTPEQRIQQHRNVIEAAKKAGVKKIVYTSIQGAEEGTAFSPVVQSNRQTELDIQNSGLAWSIGRNGIYIEPDIEYIDSYKKAGCIKNSAGDGKCGYTSRSELAYAYTRMLLDDKHNGHIYNLHGEAITQYQLAQYLNRAFSTELNYVPLDHEDYLQDRIAELGDFIGTVIAGIYQGINMGASDNPSHYVEAAGREHQSWDNYFDNLAKQPK